MRRFKNILTLYSHDVGDEAALDRAAVLAKTNGARLTVLHVVERLPRQTMTFWRPLSAAERALRARFIAEREGHLERLVSPLRREGLDVHTQVSSGKLVNAVLQTVLENQHDLVVMAGDAWPDLKAFAFGSTAAQLAGKCPCPVWVMQPGASDRFRRILAVVDPEPGRPSGDHLDIKILQMAGALARTEGCRLDVMHVWDIAGPDVDTVHSGISKETKARLLAQNLAEREALVRDLLERVDLSDLDPTLELPRGDPADLIAAFAERAAVDLIVIGTLGRRGAGGILRGDVAQAVMDEIGCSIMSVKPDGFTARVARAA